MEDNLITLQDNKKRFLLRKPIRIITLFLLYAVIKAKPTKMKTNLEYMKTFKISSKHINSFYGIATQLLKNTYKLVNVTDDEIKSNCNAALSNFSEN